MSGGGVPVASGALFWTPYCTISPMVSRFERSEYGRLLSQNQRNVWGGVPPECLGGRNVWGGGSQLGFTGTPQTFRCLNYGRTL